MSPSEINFSIVKVIDNLNRDNNIYSEISDELTDFKNDSVQRTVQLASESDFVRETNGRRREQTDADENIQDMTKSAKSQDFFHDNSATIGKRYITTSVKSINFL